MSISVPKRVFAETTIGFEHGGEVAIKLSTSVSDRFTEERLQAVFSQIANGLANELHCISHDCPLDTSDQTMSDSRHLSLVVLETEFVAEIYVSIGKFAIPFENVYFVVQAWLYIGLFSNLAEDVKLATGITAKGEETQLSLSRGSLGDFGSFVDLLVYDGSGYGDCLVRA